MAAPPPPVQQISLPAHADAWCQGDLAHGPRGVQTIVRTVSPLVDEETQEEMIFYPKEAWSRTFPFELGRTQTLSGMSFLRQCQELQTGDGVRSYIQGFSVGPPPGGGGLFPLADGDHIQGFPYNLFMQIELNGEQTVAMTEMVHVHFPRGHGPDLDVWFDTQPEIATEEDAVLCIDGRHGAVWPAAVVECVWPDDSKPWIVLATLLTSFQGEQELYSRVYLSLVASKGHEVLTIDGERTRVDPEPFMLHRYVCMYVFLIKGRGAQVLGLLRS